MDINGKVAWITGGNSGMGAATAKALVEKGAKVLITSRGVTKDENAVADTMGDNLLYIKADSTKVEEMEAAVAAAVEKWGRLDILVSAAGNGGTGGVIITDKQEDIDAAIADMDFSYKLNVMGNFNAARIAANYMAKNEAIGKRGERGVIIFIASMAADKIWMAPPEGAPPTYFGYGYGMAKAALLGITRDLAYRLADYNIRVNAIKPGWFITPLTPFSEELEKAGNPTQLFPKYGGKPEEVAHLAIAMIENAFINRAAYAIDAGVIG